MTHGCKFIRDPSQIEGRYTNYFQVGHNAVEFLLDFGQSNFGDKQARYHTRIVTSPVYAKVLLMTLQGSIERYEQSFGAIPGEEEEPPQGE